MLDGAIFIDKQPAGCANVWLLGVVEEVLEPVIREDFGIVVEKHEKLAAGGAGSEIVRAGEVERVWEQNAMSWILFHQPE